MRVTRSGFSILEVLVASSLLALVMMILFTLYPSSLVAVRRGEHMIAAATLAQSILDTYRSMPFSRLRQLTPQSTQTIPHLPPPPGTDGVQLQPSATLFRVAGHDTDPVPLVGVRVTVEWTEHDRPMRHVQELWICDIKR